jgi:cytochrome c5
MDTAATVMKDDANANRQKPLTNSRHAPNQHSTNVQPGAVSQTASQPAGNDGEATTSIKCFACHNTPSPLHPKQTNKTKQNKTKQNKTKQFAVLDPNKRVPSSSVIQHHCWLWSLGWLADKMLFFLYVQEKQ